MHVHVDAARFFNGLAEVPQEAPEIVKNCSSLMFCFSKGLCAPVGSMVVGSSKFITAFKRNRKMMGGVLRKPGVVAGAALIALKSRGDVLATDNKIARVFSQALVNLGWLELMLPIQTNMVPFKITDPSVKGEALRVFMRERGVAMMISSQIGRIVTHRYIRQPEMDKVIKLMEEFRKSVADSEVSS